MACKNCECVTEDFIEKQNPIEEIGKQINAINRFLVEKFPEDLSRAGIPIPPTLWVYYKDSEAEKQERLKRTIDELIAKGYTVSKDEPPSPTVENIIREVIVNNQVLSGCAVRAAIQKNPDQK